MSESGQDHISSKLSIEYEISRLGSDIEIILRYAGIAQSIVFAERALPNLINDIEFPEAEDIVSLEHLVKFVKDFKLNFLQILLLLGIEIEDFVSGTTD